MIQFAPTHIGGYRIFKNAPSPNPETKTDDDMVVCVLAAPVLSFDFGVLVKPASPVYGHTRHRF